MKIAYVINQYPQTSQSFIRREIAGLESLGVEVHRFTVRRWTQKLVDEGDLAEREKTRAVLEGGSLASLVRLIAATTVSAITRPGKFLLALRAALKLGRRAHRRLIHLIYLAEACVLQRWLAACGAEHIHAHFGTNSTAVALLIRILGGPAYSFTVHGPEEFDQPAALALDEKVRGTALAITISEFGRSQLLRWCRPEYWPKISVVRCGVDASFLADATPVPDSQQLVCIGRLAEQKGQLILIEAAALLAARGIPFELLLIGDGPMREAIASRIAHHRLGNQIRLAGWMRNDQIRDALKASRVMVLPSFAEGLPVVIMESLALGRPVITTFVAGIPELVKDAENGWLVPAGDVESLSRAMEAALKTNPAELSRMGHAGAARVRERHDATREAATLLQFIQASRSGQKQPLTPTLSPVCRGEGAIQA